jgi:hypothetical protein
MRVVLQNRKTLLYLQQPGGWTADVNRAANFEQILQAREFARSSKLPHLDMVMFLDSDGRPGLRMPVTP